VGEPAGRPQATPRRRDTAIDYDAEPATALDDSAQAEKTIDDRPELVAEFAEPGAEDGAGAEVEVDPPWDGYDELSADDVIERIEQLGPAELGVTELYERSRKSRRTVLAAAARRQRMLANAPD
jgi:hypothetical protein